MRAGCVVALSLALTGCGGGEASAPAGDILSETASKLGEIRSGELELKILVEPRGNSDEEFGFEVTGPFELAGTGELPKADVEYTQTANGESETVRVISTGDEAFVEVDDETYELSDAQEAELRSTGGELSGGLEKLGVDDWIVDPDASDGGNVGGAETDKVTGELDLVAIVNDLGEVARSFGASSAPELSSADGERLSDAVEETTFELYSGKDDRLLRRLLLEADVAFQVAPQLREALGDFAAAKVTFELEIANPNEPIEVEAPENAQPPNAP